MSKLTVYTNLPVGRRPTGGCPRWVRTGVTAATRPLGAGGGVGHCPLQSENYSEMGRTLVSDHPGDGSHLSVQSSGRWVAP